MFSSKLGYLTIVPLVLLRFVPLCKPHFLQFPLLSLANVYSVCTLLIIDIISLGMFESPFKNSFSLAILSPNLSKLFLVLFLVRNSLLVFFLLSYQSLSVELHLNTSLFSVSFSISSIRSSLAGLSCLFMVFIVIGSRVGSVILACRRYNHLLWFHTYLCFSREAMRWLTESLMEIWL